MLLLKLAIDYCGAVFGTLDYEESWNHIILQRAHILVHAKLKKSTVLVMNRSQSRAMSSVGTYRILESKGIPYIRFCKGTENRKEYIVDRIRQHLI